MPTSPCRSKEEPQAPIRRQDKATKPPARFTESTLLAAMEGAGKLIDDEELREAMVERARHPATRAATIGAVPPEIHRP